MAFNSLFTLFESVSSSTGKSLVNTEERLGRVLVTSCIGIEPRLLCRLFLALI